MVAALWVLFMLMLCVTLFFGFRCWVWCYCALFFKNVALNIINIVAAAYVEVLAVVVGF